MSKRSPYNAGLAQWLECFHGKEDVKSSNLLSGSLGGIMIYMQMIALSLIIVIAADEAFARLLSLYMVFRKR